MRGKVPKADGGERQASAATSPLRQDRPHPRLRTTSSREREKDLDSDSAAYGQRISPLLTFALNSSEDTPPNCGYRAFIAAISAAESFALAVSSS